MSRVFAKNRENLYKNKKTAPFLGGSWRMKSKMKGEGFYRILSFSLFLSLRQSLYFDIIRLKQRLDMLQAATLRLAAKQAIPS